MFCLHFSSQPSKMFISKSWQYKISRLDWSWYQILEIWYLISFCLNQLPDIVQKCFCTPDGPTNPTFKCQPSILFVAKDVYQIILRAFFVTPTFIYLFYWWLLLLTSLLILLKSLFPKGCIVICKENKLELGWAKLSYQLVLSCSLIKFCCILLIDRK